MELNSKKYSVVDAGNTRIKIVDFENDEIVNKTATSIDDKELLQKLLNERKSNTSILSTVLNEKDNACILDWLQPTLVLNHETPLPISVSEYETPQTLGVDRIANAVAVNYFSATENTIAIDIGTCIKFDLISNGKYMGGSISPGYKMRLKAMHEFTGSLPDLELEDFDSFVGKSTKQSMLSGVLNGVQAEVSTFIDFYREHYQPLTIFLTGGDYKKFDIKLKNSIFVDCNLTIKGLHIILKHNV